jgi:DNA-binding response OmpR family regulator
MTTIERDERINRVLSNLNEMGERWKAKRDNRTLDYSLEEQRFYVGTKLFNLNIRAKQILLILFAHRNEIVPSDAIIHNVWPNDYTKRDIMDNNIRVHIHHIRRALKEARAKAEIQTIIGKGYKLVLHDEESANGQMG